MNKLRITKISDIISSDKARIVCIVVCIAAIALIFLSKQFSNKADSKVNESELYTSSQYTDVLTAELKSMIESIEGAGETKVMLTLNNSYEYIYLDDDKTLQKIIEPTVRGVAVACKGGDDPVVKEKISQMLTTVLQIRSSCVTVSKLT